MFVDHMREQWMTWRQSMKSYCILRLCPTYQTLSNGNLLLL